MRKTRLITIPRLFFAAALAASFFLTGVHSLYRARAAREAGILLEVYSLLENFYILPVQKLSRRDLRAFYKESIPGSKPDRSLPADRNPWAAASSLTRHLRHGSDNFTSFLLPHEIEPFLEEAYGYRTGAGIHGSITGKEFVVRHVEKHSPAHLAGIRKKDAIDSINGKKISDLDNGKILSLLWSRDREKLHMDLIRRGEKDPHALEVRLRPFFMETVFERPTGKDGIYCLEIRRFNKKTPRDIDVFVEKFMDDDMNMLILDMRNNPGGPPLAISDIASTFVPPGIPLASFHKRNSDIFGLMTRPKKTYYDGRLVILVNHRTSGSAEILAASLLKLGRAVIAGNERTAGRVFIRELFYLSDGSALRMITGQASHPVLRKGDSSVMGRTEPVLNIPVEAGDWVSFVAENYPARVP